jgi:hypothetical protein
VQVVEVRLGYHGKGEKMKLIIVAILSAIAIIALAGCSVKLCECNDNSPKKIEKTISNHSSENQVLTIPRGL